MRFLWDCAFLSFRLLGMDTFNPRILDACIRDVSSYLSDSQKVDLLLYVLRSLSLNRCVLCSTILVVLYHAPAVPGLSLKTRSSHVYKFLPSVLKLLQRRECFEPAVDLPVERPWGLRKVCLPHLDRHCNCISSPRADLQAALAAEPDNVEAKALLHQRSVTIEKVNFQKKTRSF